MMMKLPWSPTSLSSSSCINAATSDISNPKAQGRLFGASSSSSSRLTISIRRRNGAFSCEAAEAKEMSVAERLRQGTLTEEGLSYKEKFIIRSYEVGINKTATIETIANLLQEVACNHVQSLGFSTDGFGTTNAMRKLHLIWATARTHIEIYKYPAWSDVVEIETWYENEGRTGTRRDYILKDYATCEVIGRATRTPPVALDVFMVGQFEKLYLSKFVMMNQVTRRLERVSDDVRKEYLGFCPREPRLAFPEEKNGSLKKIAKLEDPAQFSQQGLVPRSADLDMNHHVNNVTYIRWVLESMPPEIMDTHELETLTLDYRRECQQDNVVDSLTSREPFEYTKVSELHGSNGKTAAAAKGKEDYCQFLHMLKLSGERVEINRGRTEWRKKPTRDANHSV